MRTTKAFILAATIGFVAVAAAGVLAQAGRYPASRHGGK